MSDDIHVSATVTCPFDNGVNRRAKELDFDYQDEIETDFTPIPPSGGTGILSGLLGDAVHRICRESEATPPAVAVALIGRLCTLIGRPCDRFNAPWYQLGDSELHLRPFFLIIGPTGSGRKGTSDMPAKKLFKRIDDVLFERHSRKTPGERLSTLEQYWPLACHDGGLSSGEGLIWRLRDDTKDPKTSDVIPGEPDKRLLVMEQEFGNLLHNAHRDGNILSCTVRRLWDGQSIEPLTRHNRYRATDPHVCIIGHITSHELLFQLKPSDTHNGLMNRFMTIYSKRHRLVPLPKPSTDSMDDIVDQLADVIEFAWSAGQMTMDNDACGYWQKTYTVIENTRFGERIDALLSRSSAYCLMLSMVFALLDKRTVITARDIESGLQWIRLWRQTLVRIFDGEREQIKAAEIALLSHKILSFIRSVTEVTLTDISNHLQRHYESEKIQKSLTELMESAPPKIQMEHRKSEKGRLVKIYTPRIQRIREINA